MDPETKEKLANLKEQNWLSIEMTFEVLGVTPEIVKKSLEEHVQKLGQIKTAFVYKTSFSKIEEVKNPTKDVEVAHSQIVEVGLMVKDLKTLMAIAISYGPSSIEVLEPKKLELTMGEIQDVANMVSGILHQIAAAGLGGFLATPKSGR